MKGSTKNQQPLESLCIFSEDQRTVFVSVLLASGIAGIVVFLFLLPTPWHVIGDGDKPDTPIMALKR